MGGNPGTSFIRDALEAARLTESHRMGPGLGAGEVIAFWRGERPRLTREAGSYGGKRRPRADPPKAMRQASVAGAQFLDFGDAASVQGHLPCACHTTESAITEGQSCGSGGRVKADCSWSFISGHASGSAVDGFCRCDYECELPADCWCHNLPALAEGESHYLYLASCFNAGLGLYLGPVICQKNTEHPTVCDCVLGCEYGPLVLYKNAGCGAPPPAEPLVEMRPSCSGAGGQGNEGDGTTDAKLPLAAAVEVAAPAVVVAGGAASTPWWAVASPLVFTLVPSDVATSKQRFGADEGVDPDSDRDWDADDECTAHVRACYQTRLASEPGNHFRQSRCTACLRFCQGQGYWPAALPNGDSCAYWAA